MEHPWLLLAAALACAPLIWITCGLFFPNLREDLEEDGPPLYVGLVTDWWPASWTFLKLLLFAVLTAAYLAAGYEFAVWLLE
jgi:hypothetical protein